MNDNTELKEAQMELGRLMLQLENCYEVSNGNRILKDGAGAKRINGEIEALKEKHRQLRFADKL
ncbi:MAG: hypothetical protein JNK00_05170 [Flavipsychrobacter sp.]|nr:hypothetical protein [Flavipsychrobacter sp.]